MKQSLLGTLVLRIHQFQKYHLLRLDLRLDEGYFLQDNQCTLAFPKYLLHVLNDMQAKQLAGTNMSKLVTSGACHLEIL